VLVTHDPDVAEGCDRVIHMRDGQVAGMDELDDEWNAECCEGAAPRAARQMSYTR
jgi:ABC-type lipoprotein export system ATPase subunit